MITGFYGSSEPLLLAPEERSGTSGPRQKPCGGANKQTTTREWTSACKTGAGTVCPIEFGCQMTEMALLGSLALRTEAPIDWDAEGDAGDERRGSKIDMSTRLIARAGRCKPNSCAPERVQPATDGRTHGDPNSSLSFS